MVLCLPMAFAALVDVSCPASLDSGVQGVCTVDTETEFNDAKFGGLDFTLTLTDLTLDGSVASDFGTLLGNTQTGKYGLTYDFSTKKDGVKKLAKIPIKLTKAGTLKLSNIVFYDENSAETKIADVTKSVALKAASACTANTETKCSNKQIQTCKADGSGFAAAKDCPNGQSCDAGTKKCKADAPVASCSDSIKNQDETDVDCGGSCSTKCADTKVCKDDTDCTSTVCTAGKCAPKPAAKCKAGTRKCDLSDPTKTNSWLCDAKGVYSSTDKCVGGYTCQGADGSAKCACPTGKTECTVSNQKSCVDTQTNAANCGGCGNLDKKYICAKDQVCTAGVCKAKPAKTKQQFLDEVGKVYDSDAAGKKSWTPGFISKLASLLKSWFK